MLSRTFISLLTSIAALTTSSLIQAAPTPQGSEIENIAPRDVWAPTVLYPRSMIVWKTGYRHNVTWDTSSRPDQITNPVGQIQLRKDGVTLPAVLAQDFQLTDGRVEITVPYVEPGSGYQIVLLGDSGNFSPEFMIATEGD